MSAGPVRVVIGSHGALQWLSNFGHLIDVAANSVLREGPHPHLAAKGILLAATMHCRGPQRASLGRAEASLIAIAGLMRGRRPAT